MSTAAMWPSGSEWRRWDPHIHAPGTLLSDQFMNDWESYLTAIESASPPIVALGVTDYFCIRTYKEVRLQKQAGRLPSVRLLFPNVELRLDIKTEKQHSVNVHLLFSPDDPNHVDEIERALASLPPFESDGRPFFCTTDDFAKIGRLLDPRQMDHVAAMRAGANQFKVTLSDLRNLFRQNRWVREHGVVAVAGGSNDGAAGVQGDPSFKLWRQEVERFAHIIFASTPGQREYWLGKKPGFDRDYIERVYGALKPCLHGSDAHRIERTAAPDQDRFCWIKGDPTFEALRHAIVEPEERVWIARNPPSSGSPSYAIRGLGVREAPWLSTPEIAVNAGLVAIIGERGSGKTALLDIIARGGGGRDAGTADTSFIHRATTPTDLLGDAAVDVAWGDNESTGRRLAPSWDEDDVEERVRYLSQHFVEKLCSSAGLATELRDEIERVIFDATEPDDRLDAGSFTELSELLLDPIRERRRGLQELIEESAQTAEREVRFRDGLLQLERQRTEAATALAKFRAEVESLLPKGSEQRVKQLLDFEQACTAVEGVLEGHRRRIKRIEMLRGEVANVRQHIEPARHARMRAAYADTGLDVEDWNAFQMEFVGNVTEVIERATATANATIDRAMNGAPGTRFDPTTPLTSWPLRELHAAREAARKAVNIDDERKKKYDGLTKLIRDLVSCLGSS